MHSTRQEPEFPLWLKHESALKTFASLVLGLMVIDLCLSSQLENKVQ
jgi:hypothetical protein